MPLYVLKRGHPISLQCDRNHDTGVTKRITKHRGQYIQYTDVDKLDIPEAKPRYGRLDQILTHEAVRGKLCTPLRHPVLDT